MMTYRSDRDYYLCGYKADDDRAFPIHAYWEFCKRRGIPFPLDWRPLDEAQDDEKAARPESLSTARDADDLPPPIEDSSDDSAAESSPAANCVAESDSKLADNTAPTSSETPIELPEGLTLERVQKVLAQYPALADLMTAAAEVLECPDPDEGGVREKSAETIVRLAETKIKKRGGGWGRAKDGGLSGSFDRSEGKKPYGQKGEFMTLFETARDVGRRKKKSADIFSD